MVTAGFAADEKLGKEAKVLYHTKVAIDVFCRLVDAEKYWSWS